MSKLLLSAAVALVCMPGTSYAQLSLNTGFNNGTFVPYATPAGTTSTIHDNYWIKIASYEPPAPGATIARAWVLNISGTPWAPPLPNSRWIGPMNSTLGPLGGNPLNPSYSIFRKCFCLLAGFQNPQLNFQIRADDNVQVWLNTVTNTLVGPATGNLGLSTPPRSGGTNNPHQFQVGRNCIYVLLEDYYGGHMGFNLAGSVSAAGLMPMAGAGPNSTFEPCQCPSSQPGSAVPTGADTPSASVTGADHDSTVVASIIRFVEARRLRSLARQRESRAPGAIHGAQH